MKSGLRNAALAAAVVSTLYGTGDAVARDLVWDASGNGGATPVDDGGN